jgi:HEAT repeat protein
MKTDNDISQLIQAAKNNNQEAIEALVRIGAPSVAPLMEAASIGEDHLFVQSILKKMGLSAIEPLLSLLHHKDDRTRVLAVYEIWIIISLKKIEIPEAVEPLIKALTDNEKGVRSYSALVLGEIKDKRATEYLIQSLGDNEEYVKESVVKALGKICDRRAVDPLVNCFKKEKGSLCRSYALDSLAEIGGVEVVDPLIQALNDKDDDVRFHAASGLGLLRDPRVVGPLIQALKDNSPRVRWRAALSLGEIGDIRAVEPLNLALKDKYRCSKVCSRSTC